MYVCICNGISDRVVDQVVRAGAGSVAEVFQAVDCRPQCGRCVPHVRSMLADAGCASACDAACALPCEVVAAPVPCETAATFPAQAAAAA